MWTNSQGSESSLICTMLFCTHGRRISKIFTASSLAPMCGEVVGAPGPWGVENSKTTICQEPICIPMRPRFCHMDYHRFVEVPQTRDPQIIHKTQSSSHGCRGQITPPEPQKGAARELAVVIAMKHLRMDQIQSDQKMKFWGIGFEPSTFITSSKNHPPMQGRWGVAHGWTGLPCGGPYLI